MATADILGLRAGIYDVKVTTLEGKKKSLLMLQLMIEVVMLILIKLV